MAIVIKGDMPKSCTRCNYHTIVRDIENNIDLEACPFLSRIVTMFYNTIHSDCPIVGEIPDEHGDLVDANAFKKRFLQFSIFVLLCMLEVGVVFFC